jgi:hypothetical protein
MILKLLKYSPLPAQLVQEMQKTAAQMPPQPPKGRAQGAPQRGKQDPPELIAANVGLRKAQAQKAISQAKEIDMRTGTQPTKVALEALQTAHNARMEQAKHGHQVRKDTTEQMIKGQQAQHQQKVNLLQATQRGMGAQGGFGSSDQQGDQGGNA